MGLIQESDVRRLLQDPTLVAEIAKAVVEDPEAGASLASEIADELEDALEDDPELRRQIVEAAVGSSDFKTRIVRKLVADLG